MQLMLAQKCAECRPDAFQMQVPTASGSFLGGNQQLCQSDFVAKNRTNVFCLKRTKIIPSRMDLH